MSILEAISQAWLLEHRTLCNLAEIVRVHAGSARKSPDEIKAVTDDRDAARLASRPLDSVLANRSPAEQAAGFYLVGNPQVAVVPIEGVIANRAGMVNGVSSPRGMSDAEVVRSVKAAAESGAKAIVLHIDSPGGTVFGTSESEDAIRAVAAKMPIVAFANDQATSKAYWLGSLAHWFIGSPVSAIGSIGVYAALADTSRIAERDGVKIHVIKRGEFKAVGHPGTPIADSELKPFQDQIDRMYEQFTAVVSERRGITGKHLNQVAQGQTFQASDAMTLKLIDQIGNFETAIAKAQALASRTTTPARSGQTKGQMMNLAELKNAQPSLLAEFRAEVAAELSAGEKQRTDAAVAAAIKAEGEKKPSPATRAQLKTIVPDGMAGREDLIGKLQDDNATEAQAHAAVIAKLKADNEAMAATMEAKAKTDKTLGNEGKGVAALTFVPGTQGGDDQGSFAQAVVKVMAAEKCSYNVALAKAQKAEPEAHREWVKSGCPKIRVA